MFYDREGFINTWTDNVIEFFLPRDLNHFCIGCYNCLEDETKFIFLMMKGMHEAGWDSSPVEAEYWKQKGWIGKKRPWK